MESQMIASALGKPHDNTNNENPGNRAGSDKPKDAYHSGKRLRPNEQESARKNAPCRKPTSKPLFWDYNSHAGCQNTE